MLMTARDIETAIAAHETLLRRAVDDRDWMEAEVLSNKLVDLQQRQRLVEALGAPAPKQ